MHAISPGTNAFNNVPTYAVLKVPFSCIADYKSSSSWNNFNIQQLETYTACADCSARKVKRYANGNEPTPCLKKEDCPVIKYTIYKHKKYMLN